MNEKRRGSGRVDVLAPEGVAVPGGKASVTVWRTEGTLEALLTDRRRGDSLVIISDGLNAKDAAGVAEAIRVGSLDVIEVRLDRWDGETPSPLSGVCRAVISGFGVAGAIAAVNLLAAEK